MKNYDPNIRWGTHTVKVTFQRWDYKGFVTFRRGGNCKGLDVLALEYYQPLTDNPIGFGVLPEDDEGNKWFKMTLTNDEGDELLVEDVWEELGDYIVGLEIIAFVADKEQ
ncbi:MULTISPECIES: DUF5406 family protein [Enterococcus]|uniref:Uncharacterized protein n=2 Tax=Enterococcus faecium TaxID=1352 RepID=A0AB37HZ43_ENTFC|nr:MULTISPECIES: DUF5406 family protein [Enterococcus]EGP5080271.1 DUF5406 domain-containing protein [Enterococcus faecium]EGP5620258.1 DUF5406 domain-containing protein [Enterococcus faecium]EME8088273.1 DUF5406 family protein [Enterococcus faecium]EME8134925.1 DUF5406 family protein [Enterococcus faecium]EMF0485720.1 DUF5406 family protein [Enterococcus hirae]